MKLAFGLVHGLAVAALCTAAQAQDPNVGLGQHLFHAHCAACHGDDGQGKGWLSEYLTRKPADLTLIAKKNGGVFSAGDVRSRIDGQVEVALHGPRDMPIWAQQYEYDMAGSSNPVAAASRRIDAVVDYLRTIQK